VLSLRKNLRFGKTENSGREIITDHERELFEKWSAADPVDGWECERARLIEKAQGNENPFVKNQCMSIQN